MKSTGRCSSDRYAKARRTALDRMVQIGPFVAGTLSRVKRTAISNPLWYLTYKEQGHTRTIYVPVAIVDEVMEWTENYRWLKRLMRDVTNCSRAIIRSHVSDQRRRAVSAGRAAARNGKRNAKKRRGLKAKALAREAGSGEPGMARSQRSGGKGQTVDVVSLDPGI
jgi:hypothetical protein